MNILKQLEELNYKAFRMVKKTEYKVRAYIHNKKIDALIAKAEFLNKTFDANRPDVDRNEIPVISFDEYPTIVDVTRYLRNNFDEAYPEYIESNQERHKLLLKLIAVGDKDLELPYCHSINNGYGKYYTYKEFIIENVFPVMNEC